MGGGPILSHFSPIFGFRKFLQVFDISRGENKLFFKKFPNNGLVSETKYIKYFLHQGGGCTLFFFFEGFPNSNNVNFRKTFCSFLNNSNNMNIKKQLNRLTLFQHQVLVQKHREYLRVPHLISSVNVRIEILYYLIFKFKVLIIQISGRSASYKCLRLGQKSS